MRVVILVIFIQFIQQHDRVNQPVNPAYPGNGIPQGLKHRLLISPSLPELVHHAANTPTLIRCLIGFREHQVEPAVIHDDSKILQTSLRNGSQVTEQRSCRVLWRQDNMDSRLHHLDLGFLANLVNRLGHHSIDRRQGIRQRAKSTGPSPAIRQFQLCLQNLARPCIWRFYVAIAHLQRIKLATPSAFKLRVKRLQFVKPLIANH